MKVNYEFCEIPYKDLENYVGKRVVLVFSNSLIIKTLIGITDQGNAVFDNWMEIPKAQLIKTVNYIPVSIYSLSDMLVFLQN